MKEQLLHYVTCYEEILREGRAGLPGNSYFINKDEILCLPREDGDSRYPYGKDGFNYWTYASGYIHCNEGLFSPFLRANEGGEPKIAYFAKIEGRDLPISLLSVPLLPGQEDVKRYCVFTKEATYYITEAEGLIFGLRTFVDESRRIYFTLQVIQKTGQRIEENPLGNPLGNRIEDRRIEIYSYMNPFLKNAMMENSVDRWFRVGRYYPAEESERVGIYTLETYEEKDRSSMITNYGILQMCLQDRETVLEEFEATTSRYDFVGGAHSSLHTAKALQQGYFGSQKGEAKTTTSFTETAVFGGILRLKVKESLRLDQWFSYAFSEEEYEEIMEQSFHAQEIDRFLEELQEEEERKQKSISLRFEESSSPAIRQEVINPFMSHLLKQVEFCSVIKGYVQLSSFSLIGIRDVFQALEALLYYEPKVARAKMLEAFDFMNPEGRFPRQYSLPVQEGQAPAMDLRPFIDQGTWVISTVYSYLKFTKDWGFLQEECGYYDFIDEHKHIAIKSSKKSTVLQHLTEAMEYLLAHRDHEKTKCVLALYGDWNDALDGLGKSLDPTKEYGSGVSVMVTLQVYQNLKEMAELLKQVDAKAYRAKILAYEEARQEIKEGVYAFALTKNRIVHGWGDQMSYFVGSEADPDGEARDGITSNAFFVLSGLYREDQKEVEARGIHSMICQAYERLDSPYGLKTFHPAFQKGTKGVGRIPNLPAGTAENGATYIHASMFAVMSLFAMGEGEKAWAELIKLLPFTHKSVSVSPFVIPNSYGYNEELRIDGESMQDWQTGSSNVLFKTILRYVFGFEPLIEGVQIAPCRVQVFPKSELRISYLGRELCLEYRKEDEKEAGSTPKKARSFYLDGVLQTGEFDEITKTERLYLSDEVILRYPEGEGVRILVSDRE